VDNGPVDPDLIIALIFFSCPTKVPFAMVKFRVLFTASEDDASMIVNPVVADIVPAAVSVSIAVEPKVPEKAALPLTDSVCSGTSVPIPTRPEPVTNKIGCAPGWLAWSTLSKTGPPTSAPSVEDDM